MPPAARRLTLAACLTLLTATACGARSELVDEGSGGAKAAAGQRETGCPALASAYCDKLATCDPLRFGYGTPRGSFSFRDEAQCRERFTLACQELIPLPGVNALAQQAGTCATFLTTSTCGELPELAMFAWPTVCGLGGGTFPFGYACLRDLQCQSGRCGGSDGLCGFCAETRPDGQACGGPEGAACRVGSWCRQGICQRLPRRGEACGPQAVCADGFVCSSEAICRSAYETGPSCNGAACGPDGAPICDDRGGCVPQLVAPALGSCGNVSGAQTPAATLCGREHACVGQNDFGSGRCVPLAREGEACDRYAGPACLFPATCGAKTCELASRCSF